VTTPSRVTLARQRLGWTKRQLADQAGLSPRTITAIEKGEYQVDARTRGAIADAAGLPVEFFTLGDVQLIDQRIATFRARTKMKASDRNRALSAGALAVELNDWLEQHYVLPEPDLPDLAGRSPEEAAESTRAEWRLSDRKIPNMVRLLERQGVRVFSLNQDTEHVDAFSFYQGLRPFVFLNTQKSVERSRFDAAHELAHLLLHRDVEITGRQHESEADAFASALLMPSSSVRANAPKVASVKRLRKLKQLWGVSVSAANYRLHSLGLTSEWTARTNWVQIAELGWNRKEPDPILQRETSSILGQVLKDLSSRQKSNAYIADQLSVSREVIDHLTFGLSITSMPQEPHGRQSENSHEADERAEEARRTFRAIPRRFG
jgi:Zn-dependent peptidase ImmA (M78 family)/DNA-binding XRE family transcriptional regulator